MSIEKVDALIDAHLNNMAGWCSPEKGRRLARLVVEAATRAPESGPLCCELGVFGARALVCLGMAVEHCLARNGRVHGIDPYCASAALEGKNSPENDAWWAKIDYPKILADALRKINELNLHCIKIITSRSQDVVGEYTDGSIDVLHADANHSELCSRRDVALWAPKMRPAGFLVFDDINWETTRAAQQDLLDLGFEKIEDHVTWAVYKAPNAPCGPMSGI